MSNDLAKEVLEIPQLKIPDIGTGRMTTTTTRILMELLLEDDLFQRMEVLSCVLEYLKIIPEDINILRRNNENYGEAMAWDDEYKHEREKYSWEEE